MYRIAIDFHNRLNRGEVPVPYIVIETHMGSRAYAEKELAKVFDTVGRLLDGSFILDGSARLGDESVAVIETAGRVISFGSYERNLQSMKEDILGSYQTKTLQHLSVDLDNADGKFSRLVAQEPFIGRPLMLYVGFEAIGQAGHLKRFSGVINEMTMLDVLTIEADEE